MKFFKKTDVIMIAILVVICVVAVIFYRAAFAKKSTNAEVYYGSDLIKTIPLKAGKAETFALEQNENVTFQVGEDGSIRFLKSDCPDKVCVNAGKLSIVGQTAACLPNKLIIKLVPADGKWGADADIII